METKQDIHDEIQRCIPLIEGFFDHEYGPKTRVSLEIMLSRWPITQIRKAFTSMENNFEPKGSKKMPGPREFKMWWRKDISIEDKRETTPALARSLITRFEALELKFSGEYYDFLKQVAANPSPEDEWCPAAHIGARFFNLIQRAMVELKGCVSLPYFEWNRQVTYVWHQAINTEQLMKTLDFAENLLNRKGLSYAQG